MRQRWFPVWIKFPMGIRHVSLRNPTMGIGRLGKTTMTMNVTTMASSIVRIHAAHRIPFPTCLSYSCRRRAMMSAWSSRSPPRPQTAANPQPPLHDSPPIVILDSKAPLNPDAGSPQTAARPPPAPKITRPKPTIRAQKVALTLVSNPSLHTPTSLPQCRDP
jgi:hypothetical protein